MLIGFTILNDILIKYFAGGTQDWEGVGFITLFLLIGLILAFSIIVLYGFIKVKERKSTYFIYLFFTGIVLYGYIFNFSSLGMTWKNQPSETVEISKENGVYISNAKLSSRFIINKLDTFKITKAWYEKETATSHQGFLKHVTETGNIYFIFLMEGNLNSYAYLNKVSYKLNDIDSFTYHNIDKINAILLSPKEQFNLTFYNKEGEIMQIEVMNN